VKGKLCGDKGYIGKQLFESLFMNGIQLVTKVKNNMKNSLMPVADFILIHYVELTLFNCPLSCLHEKVYEFCAENVNVGENFVDLQMMWVGGSCRMLTSRHIVRAFLLYPLHEIAKF